MVYREKLKKINENSIKSSAFSFSIFAFLMVYRENRKENSEYLIDVCDLIKINGETKLKFSAFLFSNFAFVMVYRAKLK